MTPSSHSGIQWFFPGVGPFSADSFLVSGVSKYRIPTTDDQKFNPENVRKTWAEKLHPIVPIGKASLSPNSTTFQGQFVKLQGGYPPELTNLPGAASL